MHLHKYSFPVHVYRVPDTSPPVPIPVLAIILHEDGKLVSELGMEGPRDEDKN